MYNIKNCTECTTCGSCQQQLAVDIPPFFCMHCEVSQAPCLNACKYDAIKVFGGSITINKNNCNKCGKCIEVCPIDVIKI